MAFKKTETRATLTLTYGGLTFFGELPARMVEGHDKPVFSLIDVGLLENAAAEWIIDHGVTAPETIRALRAAAGLTATELADLFDIDKSQVSRWENGVHDPGVGIWMTVATLAMEKMKRKAPMRARLEAVKAYKANPATGEIRLTG